MSFNYRNINKFILNGDTASLKSNEWLRRRRADKLCDIPRYPSRRKARKQYISLPTKVGWGGGEINKRAIMALISLTCANRANAWWPSFSFGQDRLTILVDKHPRIIPMKFQWNWTTGSGGVGYKRILNNLTWWPSFESGPGRFSNFGRESPKDHS